VDDDDELLMTFCGIEAIYSQFKAQVYINVNDNVSQTPNHFLPGQIRGQFALEAFD